MGKAALSSFRQALGNIVGGVVRKRQRQLFESSSLGIELPGGSSRRESRIGWPEERRAPSISPDWPCAAGFEVAAGLILQILSHG
jgi:hypothetical protein